MSQMALPLVQNRSPEPDGYLVTDANVEVHQYLQNWRDWSHHTMILIGPKACGKSAMAEAFKMNSGGLYLDDACDAEDTKLFHLWNRANNEKKPLLLLSEKPVVEWGVELADLRSRLAASLHVSVGPPDQAMIEGLFQKYFMLRGLTISADALRYLEKRMIRSYAMVRQLARTMDALAIETKRPINLTVAKSAFELLDSGDRKMEI